MAATDGQIILAASRFGDTTPMYLRDFSKTELPAIAKIIKGQHHNLGVPTLSNPSLQSTALFLNAGKKYQILAQPIKIKEGRKCTNVGPKVLIPETYPGYFELLSEDGRSTRCIDNVVELSKRRNLRVLVRETFRCNHNSKTIHAGDILTTINDNGKYLQCKTIKDEIVNIPMEAKAKFSPIAKEDSISGVHSVKNLLQKRMPVVVRLVHGTAPKGLKTQFVPELRLLGCVEVDRVFALPLQKDHDLVAVPLNAKIKLQRVKNMDQLENFIEYTRCLDKAYRLLTDARDRLQIVDLKLAEKEKKESSKHSSSSGSRKLIPTITPALEGGYILRKSASCDSTKYIQTTNFGTMADEYDEIDLIYDYVRGFAPLPKNLNRFEPIPEPVTTTSNNNNNNNNKTASDVATKPAQLHQHYHPHHQHHITHHSPAAVESNGNYSSLVGKGTSDSLNQNHNNNNIMNNNNNNNINNTNNNNINNHNNNNNNNNSIESIKHSTGHHHHHHHHYPTHIHNHNLEEKPIPPPIETIPGKKQPEKRQRPTLPKLYVKNASSLNHHGKTSTPTMNGNPPTVIIHNSNSKDMSTGGTTGEPQSPLFHIRYKSLSSLQLTPSDSTNPTTPITPSSKMNSQERNHQLSKSASAGGREGTLDSSRSGGRTSGDSKLPEKKTRRLSRPRSLSNLVWDLRPQKEKSKKKLYVHQFDHRQQGTLYL